MAINKNTEKILREEYGLFDGCRVVGTIDVYKIDEGLLRIGPNILSYIEQDKVAGSSLLEENLEYLKYKRSWAFQLKDKNMTDSVCVSLDYNHYANLLSKNKITCSILITNSLISISINGKNIDIVKIETINSEDTFKKATILFGQSYIELLESIKDSNPSLFNSLTEI